MTVYTDSAAAIEERETLQSGEANKMIDVDFSQVGEACGDDKVTRLVPKKPLYYRFIKRLFDIVFSIAVIVVAFDTKAFPIYTQERIGRKGPFRFYKLRSMVADSDDVEKYFTPEQLEQWRKEYKVDNDPRITKLGRLIRRTSLDEVPQFLNVALGQIPQRIIKTGQGEPCEISGLFALPAKEMRTGKALFLQVKVASGASLRTVRKFFSNLTARSVQTQRVLQNTILSLFWAFIGLKNNFLISLQKNKECE